VRREVRALVRLAAPVAATQLAYMLLGAVDTAMLGYYRPDSTDEMNAAMLGNVWMMSVQMFAMGVLFGIDPIVSQAHGRRDGARAGLALQQGLVLCLPIGIATAIVFLFAERGLRLLGQDPELSRMAQSYVLVNLPGLLPFLGFVVLRSYLQGRGIVKQAMWLALGVNVLNALANWVLIYGNLGAPSLGLEGSGIASSLSRIALFVGMATWIVRGKLHTGAWHGWTKRALERPGLSEVLFLGVPIGLQFSLEIWAFQVIAVWAGQIGKTQLAAHNVTMTLASLTFMIPLGIAIGATTRVGNLIGAGKNAAAQRASWVALGMGAAVMFTFALTFLVLRGSLPFLFTPEEDAVSLAAAILPIAAAFQVSDGTQVVGGGILRGMGRTRPAAVFNLVAYYLLALPTAYLLAFDAGLGLRGLWWGLFLGLTAVAGSVLVYVRVRGPATAIALERR
jgi:MATE family multidrug resistance protein